MPTRKIRTPLTGLLLLALVLTPWLSFWSTPQLARTAAGETVVICTLEGLKTIRLDANGIIADTPAPDGLHCPALHLAKLFSQTVLPGPMLPDLPIQAQHSPHHHHHYTHIVPHLSVYSERAPPHQG
ncbi:MAG: hypothetical protein KDI15_10160 [Thiothrix sp.]|nr:hypothetical protein [Thiothrix sp.]HPE61386.1 hypothetical protein [Thiolinea sp.]